MNRPAPIEVLFPELASFAEADFAKIGTARPTLMMAMTARTGSTHLCSGLASVLPIGDPTEIFNGRDNLVFEKQNLGIETYGDYLKGFFAQSTGEILFKTNWLDFQYFEKHLHAMFPNLKIIYLNRFDVEAQAVSVFKAIVTNVWHMTGGADDVSKVSVTETRDQFDLPKICDLIAVLEREKAAWERFFFENDLQPTRVHYEHFQSDLAKVVDQVARHMGFNDVNSALVKSRYRQVSDDLNQEWLKKVRNYRNGTFYRTYAKKAAMEIPG